MKRPVAILTILAALFGAGAAAAQDSVVVTWNRLMLETIAANPPAPTLVTWRMYIVSTSMYDAWAAYDDVAVGTQFGDLLRRPAAEHTVANKEAAVSYAAYRALLYVYPNQKDEYDALMADLGYPLSNSTDLTTPAGIANVVTDAVIASRETDGSNALGGFQQVTSPTFPELYEPVNSPAAGSPGAPGGEEFDPNHWQPLRVPTGTVVDGNGNPVVDPNDPDSFVDQSFLTPHWGAVRPFAMTDGSQFLPPAPPQRGSAETYTDFFGNVSTNDEAYVIQANEVLAFNATLTDRQKVIAEFWADGPRTWTPPGHWNQIAQGISIRDQHTVGDDVKMFFALNAALLDAAISSWDAKRRYDFVRPVSALQDLYFDQEIQAWGGPNQGTQTILGQEWQPYQQTTFVTPAFAEYVSGHSTFSRASREALFLFAGTDELYDGVTTLGDDFDGDGVEDMMGEHIVEPGGLIFEDGPDETIVLRWDTMLEASDEAGISRLYGGIHFQDGDRWGREMGRQIGEQAFARAQQFWQGIDQGNTAEQPCVPGPNTLCVGDRWEIQVLVSTDQGDGANLLGHAVELTEVGVDQGGLFWFFDSGNPELLIKVLDGCSMTGHHWVLASASSNVGFTLRVRDTQDGSLWTHTNPDRNPAAAIIDTEAQPCD